MAKETLLQIQEAEMKVKTLMENAQFQADSMIENAVKETENEFSRLTEQCRRYESDEKEAAEKNALIKSGEFEKQTQILCNDLEQKLLSQKSKAVNLVIQMITE